MSVIKMEAFTGMLPAIDPRVLPQNSCFYAQDIDFYGGALIGWRLPHLLRALTNTAARSVFRVPALTANVSLTDTSYWLEFVDVDTNVLRTPVVGDTYERYYMASPSVRPKYNILTRIAAGLDPWFLGVPAPTTAPGVAPSGGSGLGIQTSRSYVYTYLTAYGEESAPSPPLVQDGYLDDTWALTVTAPTANDQGVDRNITQTNIYRTVTAIDGTASFFLVATIAAATTSYNDSLTDDDVAANVLLPSTTWTEPPTDLQGLTQGPNGMFVGFRTNEIWFSEPFRPHAWPSTYVITSEFPIVGIGVVGQSFVVCTKGYPMVITGIHPSSMSEHVVRRAEPCTSRGSIVSGSDGVTYASPNGLIQVTPYGTVKNLTEMWILRANWSGGLVGLRSMRAIRRGPAYWAFGSVFINSLAVDDATQATFGFVLQTPDTGSEEGSTPQGTSMISPGFSFMRYPNELVIYNFFTDYWTDTPMLIQDGKIYYYDFTEAAPTFKPYQWRSKIFQDTTKRGYSAMRVWFDTWSGITTQNSTRNVGAMERSGSPGVLTLLDDQYGVLRVYGDGNLVTTREIRNSGELLRIASGQKYEFWQWEIEARVKIINLQVATSVKELSGA